MFCGFCAKEGNYEILIDCTNNASLQFKQCHDVIYPANPIGQREAGRKQLPQQPWGLWVWNIKVWANHLQFWKARKKALDFKPNVMFLMETRFEKERGKVVWVKCGFFEGWDVPREGFNWGTITCLAP